MTDGRPDHLPPELLAAYADGELAPADRARVERWLLDHPEARDVLEAQESLGPGNTELWQGAEPPAPSAGQWRAVFREVHSTTCRPAVRRRRPWAGPAALVATAALVLLTVPTGNRPQPPPTPRPAVPIVAAAPDVDDEPIEMARADDVRIVSLPEAAAKLLVVGEHPLHDPAVVLAKVDEMEFFGMGSDHAGRFPEVPSAVDTPLLWAPGD